MSRKKKHEEHVNHERWLVSYADFITLLFATFTALYALGNADIEKFKKMALSMDQAFNGAKPTIAPVISIDPAAKGTGDMVINIMEAPATKAVKGDDDGPHRGGGQAMEDPVQAAMAKAIPDAAVEQASNGETPKPTPEPTPAPEGAATPAPTPAPDAEMPATGANPPLLVSGAEVPNAAAPHPEAAGLGTAEGKANDALAQQIQQLMQDVGVSGKIAVRKETRGTVISLGEAAFFQAGGVDVMPQSVHTLSQILNALRGKEFEVRIEGHTDNIPVTPGKRYSTNEELSSLRAASIMNFMMKEYQFPGNKLSIAGFGAWRPIASNDTPEGRAKNRRVDIVILNQSEAAKDPH